ncbi:hypothetical protein ACFL56_03935, partial [Candidatus Margulisiibacteriota bacterium]
EYIPTRRKKGHGLSFDIHQDESGLDASGKSYREYVSMNLFEVHSKKTGNFVIYGNKRDIMYSALSNFYHHKKRWPINDNLRVLLDIPNEEQVYFKLPDPEFMPVEEILRVHASNVVVMVINHFINQIIPYYSEYLRRDMHFTRESILNIFNRESERVIFSRDDSLPLLAFYLVMHQFGLGMSTQFHYGDTVLHPDVAVIEKVFPGFQDRMLMIFREMYDIQDINHLIECIGQFDVLGSCHYSEMPFMQALEQYISNYCRKDEIVVPRIEFCPDYFVADLLGQYDGTTAQPQIRILRKAMGSKFNDVFWHEIGHDVMWNMSEEDAAKIFNEIGHVKENGMYPSEYSHFNDNEYFCELFSGYINNWSIVRDIMDMSSVLSSIFKKYFLCQGE